MSHMFYVVISMQCYMVHAACILLVTDCLVDISHHHLPDCTAKK